jgi:hypothetical protein
LNRAKAAIGKMRRSFDAIRKRDVALEPASSRNQ